MKKLVLLSAIALAIYSCAEEQSNPVVVNPTSEQEKNITKDSTIGINEDVKHIIYAIPSPNETMEIIEAAGAFFDVQLTNDPTNKDNYTSKTEKALNLGVYGADINYCSAFGKSAEIILISPAAQSLSEQLGLSSIFSQDVYDRINENLEDPDSVQRIITDTYWNLESYLREEGRPELATLIALGGWLEGMYIACGQAKINDANKAIVQRIAEQKYSLANVIGMTECCPGNGRVKELTLLLKDLKTSFDKIEEVNTASPTTEGKDGLVSIGGKIDLHLPPELLEEITVKVYNIREDITH